MPPWIVISHERTREKHRRWAARHPERAKANAQRQNEYEKQWRKENRDLVNATERRYRAKHRDHYNMRTQAWRYGLTKTQLERMIARQGARCAICREQTKLHVDHDHATNRVRALLCNACNRGLGAFRDDARLLKKAVKYLAKHGA